MQTTTCRHLWLLLVLLSSWRQPLEAGPPTVEHLSPTAGQRGTRFSLTVFGGGLGATAEMMLYHGGVTCESIEAVSDNEVVLRLAAASDCLTGTHPFRLRTPQGVSSLQIFRISPLPVVSELEDNNSIETAQAVTPDVTVTGVIEAGDVDCFRLSLKRGERLAAEAEAIRAGGTMLDVVLNVMSADGTLLASADDTPLARQDPFLSVIVPADGDYFVELHETGFEGDESSRYALHLGTFPRPAWVYPAGGRAGEPLSVVFGGDAAGEFSQLIHPVPAQPDSSPIFAELDGKRSPTALPFRVCEFGNVLEAEPDDSTDDSTRQSVEIPIALNGVLRDPGDADTFRIHVPHPGTFRLEAFASRLGSPVDSLLSVSDTAGRLMGVSDDGAAHDSLLLLSIPESGEYDVRMTDKRANGGENFIYRIEISAWSPEVTPFLPRPNRLSQDGQAILVPRGNRVLASLACQRSGFTGDVRLTASGLPPGVTVAGVEIPADRFWVPTVISAGADAPISGALVEVEATAETAEGPVSGRFRQVVDLVAGSADQLFLAAETDRLAVAVVDDVPYSVSLEQPAAALAADGTLDLHVTVQRAAGFEGAIDVSIPFLPPWVDGPAAVTIDAGVNSAVYTLRAWPRAEPRTWMVCAEARPGQVTSAGAGSSTAGSSPSRSSSRRIEVSRLAVASDLVALRIDRSPVSGRLGQIVAEQGVPLKVECPLEGIAALPDELIAVLEGLPNRVTAQPVPVTSRQPVIEFHLDPDITAPTGIHNELVVRLTGRIKGQEMSWRTGRGSSLRIEPSGGLIRDATGRPLTRLELLRLSAVKQPSESTPSLLPDDVKAPVE